MTPEDLSYLLGFLQTDAHMERATRNRGKISIELSEKDNDILYKLQEIIPVYSSITNRIRDTNFKKDVTSSTLRIYNKDFRECINNLGLPYGSKSDIINAPAHLSKVDYWRGIIDGDGSLGFTDQGFPFLSLCTTSDQLAIDLELFLFSITGKRKKLTRNKRDGAYNICVTKEDAQKVSKCLYYEGCLSLNRKSLLASNVVSWARPLSMIVRAPIKSWTKEQDEIILNNNLQTSIDILNRTDRSIKMRLWRLKNGK